jgi:dihydroorotase-like cyclic amidohydrolase
VDLNAKTEITPQKMASKAGWTPFEGFQIRGAINKVVLRGEIAFENGNVLAPSGIGRHID